MKILFVAPRFHTNQSTIVKTLINKGHRVYFHVSTIGPTEDYSNITPEIIEESILSIIRTKIFGDGGKNKKGYFPKIIKYYSVIKKISPKIYGDGSAKRNYIYLWDIAKAVDVIIENNITGVHFLAGSERSTVSSMVTQVCTVLGEGISPDKQSGNKAKSQLVNPSDVLPKTRSFQNGLEDIKLRLYL